MRHVLLALLLFLAGALPADDEFGVVERDRVPYKFKSSSRVVAIGDLHGDADALVSILLARKLINQEGEWIGGNADLVILGDFAGKTKKKTRRMLDTIRQLEASAKSAGGRVHTLIGNADLYAMREWTFLGNEPKYRDWLFKRNAIIQIDDRIYVHGGLDRWAKDNSLAAINSTLRDWLAYYLTDAERPPENTSWIVSDRPVNYFGRNILGPLWTRTFRIADPKDDSRPTEAIKRKRLRKILADNNANSIVIGHNPTPDTKISVSHPYYGNMVLSLDTRISNKDIGQLASIEFKDGRSNRLYADRTPDCRLIFEKFGR